MKHTFFTRARERKDRLKYVCTVEQLKQHIALDADEVERVEKIAAIHPMRITEYYLSLIDKNDKNDPIRNRFGLFFGQTVVVAIHEKGKK